LPSPFERVTTWFRASPKASAPGEARKPPSGNGYTEIPPVSFSDFDNLARVKAALAELEAGRFEQAADLIDAMGRDDRIEGVTATRLDALHGAEFSFDVPEGEEQNKQAEEIADEARRGWPRWIPEDAQRDLRFWGLWLGVSIAQVRWELGDTWEPRVEVWHGRNIRWDGDAERKVGDKVERGCYVVSAKEGQTQVWRGDPRWIVYTPYGYRRGWMRGLVRSLAVPWLIRQWAYRDWAGHSEAHGSPSKLARVPPGTEPKEKRKFLREVALLAKRSAILLEQGKKSQTGETPGYDVDLLEASADSHQVFKELKAAVDTDIAVRVKGQNLTTEVKTGSYAATAAHREVDDDKLRFDAETTSTCLREQLLIPWAAFNHGSGELAPWPCWDTEPPEDLKARAETLDKLGDGLKKLGDAAMPVDAAKLAEEFRIPLRDLKEDEKALLGAPTILEHHIKHGIPSENEVRARLRLPPRAGGDIPTKPVTTAAPPDDLDEDDDATEPPPKKPRKMKASAAARAALAALAARGTGDLPASAVEGQEYADDLVGYAVGDAAALLAGDVAALLRIVRETPGKDGKPDGEALRRAILAHYRGMDEAKLTELTRKVMVLGEMNGRAAVAEDVVGGA
jgi:phage gp29-like protein